MLKLLQNLLTKNDCYTKGKAMTVKGVMVHSTGANNPNIKRYVQPDICGIGKNTNNNDWNRSGVDKCVHAFIGKLADGSIAACQTLPWNWRGWHAGTGTSGKSANDGYISFEICEDSLQDCEYFNKVYQTAVELTAFLCNTYKLDPLKDGVVICHSEGYTRGIASGHADVMHWFPKFGKNMDIFREDVKKAMNPEKVDVYKDAKEWAVKMGVFKGDGNGNYNWNNPITREQVAQVLYNMKKAGL